MICLQCKKEFYSKPSRVSIFCSKTCYNQFRGVKDGYITKICPICNHKFVTLNSNNKNKSRKTCSTKCSKVRKLSNEGIENIKNKLKKVKRCKNCKIQFYPKTKERYCSHKCKQESQHSYYNSNSHKIISSKGGKISAFNAREKSRSQIEQELLGLLEHHNHKKNSRIEGWEVDILLEDNKIGIEYNGPWHYRPIMGVKNLNRTKNRDRLKWKTLKKLGYIYHPVFWALKSHDSFNRLKKESLFIEEIIKWRNGQLTPFFFVYDFDLFEKQYNLLKSGEPGNHMYCIDLIDFYHKHIWFMTTKKNKMNAVDLWNNEKDKIIHNRNKYANLKPRSIRRYFRLLDITPSMFQDSLGKQMALMIDGDFIVDPFAGFGGRMLGACSVGKKYLGFDNNKETANANMALASDFDLNAQCEFKNSTDVEIECDGIITSPPYFNKDNYGDLFQSIHDYGNMINRVFTQFKARDKIVIDFKSVKGCSLDDFVEFLPLKILKIQNMNFGGMGRKSIHNWIVAKKQ